MNEIVQEFLVETTENLDQLDRDLVALEREPASENLLSRVFRTIHTIKGTTGFLGFSRLEALTHATEHLLSDLRDGRLVLTGEASEVLLGAVDAMRAQVAAISATGEEDGADPSALIARIERAGNTGRAGHTPAGNLTAAASRPRRGPEPKLVVPPPPPGGTGPGAIRRPDQSVRVHVDVLDRILRQVGELVLARNQISRSAAGSEQPDLRQGVQRLSSIVAELREGVAKTRMQPIGQLWSKTPRVVRDLANQLGKLVDLETEGGETELDRSLVEAMKDPLTHLVRNAVDHGLETPERRRAAGKAETGVLSLRARQEGGQVVLEVADDGAGISPEHVAARALQHGVVTAGELASMSQRQIVDLLFLPGVSTAETVTNVSGRGVGMDVVRTNVERVGGTIELQSTPGAGTTFKIKVPLTLAIVPGLLVACGGERYAIAQANVRELVQVRLDGRTVGLERIGDATVYRLRGDLLPLVELATVLGLAAPHQGVPHQGVLGPAVPGRTVRGRPVPGQAVPDRGPASGEPAEGATTVVVLQARDGLAGLVVDEVVGTEEIVVEPLGRHLQQIPVFAGATILGDGAVALVLDVAGIAHAARLHDAPTPDVPAPDVAGRDVAGRGVSAPGSAAPDVATRGVAAVELLEGRGHVA